VIPWRTDRRGLAGAVRTEEPEDLSALDAERDPVDGQGRAVALREALDVDDRLVHGALPARA
jgi:hypothetical protein